MKLKIIKTMKIKIIVLVAALFVTSTVPSGGADVLSEALQKGLLEEEANHNLDAAIQAYQSVVNQFGDQRKVAATAVFRLGECYRKQGKTNEAVVQYRRVLEDFADQASLVGPSEKNLAALGRASNQAEGGQVAVSARTITDPDQLKLLKEEIKLVESQLAAAEAQFKVGKVGFDEIAKSKKALLELQRQLPENATAASQKSLLDGQIQLVEQLLKEKKKQVEVGAAPPLDTTPLERELLGLKREALAVSATSSKAGGSFSEQSSQNALAKQLDEETKAIERYKALAQNSPDLLNAKDKGGNTPLHYAAARGEMAVAKFLLANGADVNSKDSKGLTPLHDAAQLGQKTMVELLLSHHADANAKSFEGITPLHLAASKGFLSVTETLLANGADMNAEMAGTAIEPFRSEGFGGIDSSYLAATPLHYAAAGGHLAIVRLLFEHKSDVNAKTKGGQTPLFAAIEKDRIEVAKFLLANQAGPNVKANDGSTLLGAAVRQLNLELVKLLLAAGADVNANGIPLGSAPTSSGSAVANILSPLAFAASKGKTELTELFLKNRADVNAQDDYGNTPLSWASRNGHVKMVKWLLDNGADPNLKNRAGDTPLHLSTSKQIHELLLARQAEVNAKNELGWTPLHFAVRAEGAKELIELLLSKGADVNAVDANGQSALFLAVMDQNKESVESLLRHGADVKAKDKGGHTPLGYVASQAASAGTRVPSPNRVAGRQTASPTEIFEILRKHGATE